MRKLAVIGALAAGTLAAASGAGAAQVTSLVGGSLANSTNTCFNIVVAFLFTDCSYAWTRYPSPTAGSPLWIGPVFATGFYPKGSPQDGVGGLTLAPAPNDGKQSTPLSGSVIVDTQDTAPGTDDEISFVLAFGEAVHHGSTGQGDFATETWDEFIHTMPATAVNFATANADGGFDYVIGSRGRPTPVSGPLAGVDTNTGLFASETASELIVTGTPLVWATAGGAALPLAQRIGIERSAGFGNTDNTGATLSPNVGAQTTAVFTNYTCLDNGTDDDCSTSEILFGTGHARLLNENGTKVTGDGTPNQANGNCADGIDNGDGDGLADAADPQCAPLTSPPGFENVILMLSTDANNRVKTAQAFWTREYVVKNGPQIANDQPAGQTRYSTNNSWTGGRFDFKGCSLTGPIAENDNLAVVEGAVNAQLLVVTNDTVSCTEPNTFAIVSQPVHGTATVSGSVILYTPDTDDPGPNTVYDGPDSLTYFITDDDDEVSAVTTVSITVTVKAPTASNASGTSQGGAPVTRTVISGANLGSGTTNQHTIQVGATIGSIGSCSASGTQLTFTPTSGGGNGIGGCNFTITDVDGDVSNTAAFNVDVQGNSGGGGGSAGPQLPSGGSLDALTLGALLAGIPLVARRRRKRA